MNDIDITVADQLRVQASSLRREADRLDSAASILEHRESHARQQALERSQARHPSNLEHQ